MKKSLRDDEVFVKQKQGQNIRKSKENQYICTLSFKTAITQSQPIAALLNTI